MNKLEKFFRSKIAFTVFVLIVFAAILIFAKNHVVASLFSGIFGAFVGFTYTSMYWKAKWNPIQKKIEELKKNNEK